MDLASPIEEVKGIGHKTAEVLNHAGIFCLRDLIYQLPRSYENFQQAQSIKDLKPGMELTGTVRNVIDFGVFVDIGVHQDGLVHISQLADKFVSSPGDVVKLGQQVMVRVVEVDLKRGRISLSMRGL